MGEQFKKIIELLKDEAAKSVIKALVAKSSFFASFFMTPVLAWFVPFVIDILYDKGALAINWVWILVDNHVELKRAIDTKEKLQAILAAGGDYTKAEEAFNEATDDLIHRGGGIFPR